MEQQLFVNISAMYSQPHLHTHIHFFILYNSFNKNPNSRIQKQPFLLIVSYSKYLRNTNYAEILISISDTGACNNKIFIIMMNKPVNQISRENIIYPHHSIPRIVYIHS